MRFPPTATRLLKNWWPAWLVLATVVVLGMVALFKPKWGKPEPYYGGRPLSYWLARFSDGRVVYPPLSPTPAAMQRFTAAITEQQKAREALLALGSHAAPHLARMLGATDSAYTRRLYPTLLRRLPVALSRHLPPPRDALFMRSSAQSVLLQLGPRAESAVPELIRQFRSPMSEVRRSAAETLGWIGAPAAPAVPVLLAGLHDNAEPVRGACAYAVARIGTQPESLGAAILQAWNDRQVSAFTVMECLQRLQYHPRESLPVYLPLLESADPDVARRAIEALARFDAAAAPGLAVALAHPESRVCAQAATALGKIGPAASPAVPALTQAFTNQWWYVRENVVLALGAIAPQSEAARKVFQQALADVHPDVQAAASNVLQRAGK